MLELIEDVVIILLIIWFVDHVICRGRNSSRVWITIDITLIVLFLIRWIFNMFG